MVVVTKCNEIIAIICECIHSVFIVLLSKCTQMVYLTCKYCFSFRADRHNREVVPSALHPSFAAIVSYYTPCVSSCMPLVICCCKISLVSCLLLAYQSSLFKTFLYPCRVGLFLMYSFTIPIICDTRLVLIPFSAASFLYEIDCVVFNCI